MRHAVGMGAFVIACNADEGCLAYEQTAPNLRKKLLRDLWHHPAMLKTILLGISHAMQDLVSTPSAESWSRRSCTAVCYTRITREGTMQLHRKGRRQ